MVNMSYDEFKKELLDQLSKKLGKTTRAGIIPVNKNNGNTKEAVRIKYPSEHRPETILTDETGTINLMFQYMEGEVDSETIETFRNQVFGLMKYANPGIKEREVGEVDIDGHRIAYVEFTNNALGGKLYNLMFYISFLLLHYLYY